METSKASLSYSVKGELLTVGSKKVTVRCPRRFVRVLESKTYLLPISEYFRRSKDEEDIQNIVTFFRLKLLDCNYVSVSDEHARTYEVQFEVPEEASQSVICENIGDSVQVKFVPGNSPGGVEFWNDLNSALQVWEDVVRVKCDNTGQTIDWRPLNPSECTLKWTSKTTSAADFVQGFNPVLHKFVVCVGVGYHSTKESKIGVSLSLGMFYNLTQKGAYMKKVEQNAKSKKRKVMNLDANGEEIGEPLELEGGDVDLENETKNE